MLFFRKVTEMNSNELTRRQACQLLFGGAASLSLGLGVLFTNDADCREKQGRFRLRYIVASSMYGCLALSEILPEVHKAGAEYIDIWPRKHGNQREQIDEIGHDKFAQMLDKHNVKLGMLTRYDLGPFGLLEEMKVARRFGTRVVITGSRGPVGTRGDELKRAVKEFIEKMKPYIIAAEEAGVTIGIENHGHSLIKSPDSMLWMADFAKSEHIGIALAPYHLPQEPKLIATLIKGLGPRLVHFYAWQHGKGCPWKLEDKLPKEEEMKQLPGYGPLDFVPIVAALKTINYQNWTSIFMHPTPRGIPILPTAQQTTDAINKSRRYLENCLAKL